MNHRKYRKQLACLLSGLTFTTLIAGTLPADILASTALPTGGQVVSGSATISQTGPNHLQIDQSSRAAIINWGGFSIGREAGVHFANGSGATLNRVTGALPSHIDGSLTATGSVFLVNQAGIVVGSEGRVNTGGSFIASTHDVSNSAFLAGGDLLFSGASDAVVINAGKIGSLGGDVALIARRVENTGSLTAPRGTAALAAGYEVLVRDYAHNDGRFTVRIGGSDTAAINSGVIEAAAAELRAQGGNIYALAGNTAGIIKATNLDLSGGRIVFDAGSTGTVELAGNIDASSAAKAGGSIIATGDTITVKSAATLDASGATGGKILLGGDYQGGINPANNFADHALATASTTTVEAGSLLRADGLTGSGGDIVVWADDLTTYAGHLSAQAFGLTGDGGFAEVSGKNLLAYTGTADLRSTHGATGSLLLDPYNITISSSATSNGSLTGGTFTPTGNSSILRASDLIAALGSANVLVTTGGEGSPGEQAGNITVAAALEWSSGNSLELSAYNNVIVNADINAGSGSVILRADNSGKSTGTVTITEGRFVTATGGLTIFFNPSVNTALDESVRYNVNSESYVAPTENFAPNIGAGTPWTALMLVNNIYDLQNIQNNTSGARAGQTAFASGRFGYALGRDIDASETWEWNVGGTFEGFQSIGDDSSYIGFTAPVFDGQGHVISNIYLGRAVTGSHYDGLFAVVREATIKNFGLVGGTIRGGTGGGTTGAIAGYVDAQAVLDNVYVFGTTITVHTADSFPGVGGLVGYLADATIRNSFVATDIEVGFLTTPDPSSAGVGGLVGWSLGTIESSFFTGKIHEAGTPSTRSFVGALVGTQWDGVVRNSYWETTQTSNNAFGSEAYGTQSNLVGLTKSQLANFASFTGFDSSQWVAPGSLSPFPVLKVFGSRSYNVDEVWRPVTYAFSQPTLNLVYGAGAGGLTAILNGLQGDATDTVRGVVNLQNANGSRVSLSALTNAGSYTLVIAGLTGEGAANYRISDTGNTTAQLTISPAPLVITFVNQEKTKGTNIAGVSGSSALAWIANAVGLKNEETILGLTLASLGFTSSAANGYYPITQATNPLLSIRRGTSTNVTANYAVTYVPGTLTVTGGPEPIATPLNYFFDSPFSWVYGNAAGQPTYTLSAALSLTLDPTHAVSGVLQVKNSSNQVVTWNSLLNAGTYSLSLSGLTGADSDKYYLLPTGNTDGALTINKAPLTLTLVNLPKDFGALLGAPSLEEGATAAWLASAEGLKNGEVVDQLAVSSAGFAADAAIGTYDIVGANALILRGRGTENPVNVTSNYAITYVPGTLTVAGAAAQEVTYDFSGNAVTSWVYGADNRGNITWTLNGVEGGDAVTGVLAIRQGGTDVTAQALLNAGSYTLHIGSLVGDDASGYRIAAEGNTPGSLTVNRAPLELTVGNLTKVYGEAYTLAGLLGTHFSITAGQLYGTDAVTGVVLASDGAAATAGVNGGTAYAVTASDAAGSGLSNYDITYTPGALTVTPAALTVTASNQTKDHGQAFTFAGTEFTVTGLKNDDAVTSATLASDGAAAGAAIGPYAITVSDAVGSGLGNYTISYVPGTLTVQAVLTDVTYAFGSPYTWSYGDTPGTITWTLNGLIGGDADTVTGVLAVKNGAGATVTLDALLNAGSYTLTIGSLIGDNAENYRLAATGHTDGSLTITPRVLTLGTQGTVAGTKVYDGTTDIQILTHGLLANVVNDDSVALALTAAYADKNAGDGKSVTGSYALTSNDAGNYVLAPGAVAFTGTASISQKDLTIGTQGTVNGKVYDGTTDATAATHGALAGLIDGDTVALTLGNLVFASKNAGSQGVTGFYAIAGADVGNYTLSGNAFTGTATITPATLTIGTQGTVAASKVYDGTTVIEVLTHGSLAGLIGSDTVTLTLAAAYGDKNAGTGKTVTGTYATSGADAGNYTLAGAAFTGTASITPKEITLGTSGTVAASKIYDGTTAIEVLTHGSLAGLIGSDAVTVALAAAYADQNAGESKDVAGLYTLGGTDGNNYVLADATFAATAAIEKAVLTYLANAASRVQGAANPAFTGSVTGFVADETLATATTGSLTWTSPADVSSAPGVYAINGGGLEAQNYTFAQAAGNATALTVTTAPVGPTDPEIPVGPGIPTVEDIADIIANHPAFEGQDADQIARSVIQSIVVFQQTPRVIEGGSANTSSENAAERTQGLVNEVAPPPAPGSLTNEPSNGVDPDNLRQFGPYIRVSSL
ncbi:hypothetical protein OPIT5_06325 [Opitutaceae bacterium TAV5]|nr:hypothetical protein OPIT5_06325 [Opitutaceae bacterium TAV5]